MLRYVFILALLCLGHFDGHIISFNRRRELNRPFSERPALDIPCGQRGRLGVRSFQTEESRKTRKTLQASGKSIQIIREPFERV